MHQGGMLELVLLGDLLALPTRKTLSSLALSLLCNILISIVCASRDHFQEVINRFSEGESLAIKFHCASKHFSISSSNRNNCSNALKDDLYFLTNQLEHEFKGTRIADVHELVRSALKVKIGMTEHCRQLELGPFLSEDD